MNTFLQVKFSKNDYILRGKKPKNTLKPEYEITMVLK